MEFVPFTPKDFDAYLENKWQSNAFNRERLDVRQKLEALGRLLAPAIVAGDGSLLAPEVSAEHPALWNQRRVENQHLFFSRNEEARKEIDGIISKKRSMAALIEDPSPLRNHIFLALMIDRHQVELSLKLHSDAAVDRDNLVRKSQEYFQREKLLGLIQDLPDEYTIGFLGREQHPTATLDDETLQQLIRDLPGADSWLALRMSVSRDETIVREPGFVDVARESLTTLLPLYNFVAWSRDNDCVSMRDTLKQQQAKKKSKGLVKNDRVRVVRGVFSGKTGVVQDTDTKGGLRVLLGSMVAKLKGEDVTKL